MSQRVLFVGDINVDVIMGGLPSLPVVDKEIACASFDVTLGSAAVISAASYASLGGQCTFLGLAGRDDYGEFMVRGMQELGIETDRVLRTDKEKTGVTVNLIYGTTRTQVTYPGTISAFDGAEVKDSIFDGVRHVHFAGPYQQTRFRPHITRLLKAAKVRGVTSSLDPQWDASERWELMDEWLPLLTYLFVNEGEAGSIAKTQNLEEACRTLSSRTNRVLCKAGPDGSLTLDQGKFVRQGAFTVKVVDTTGAGDNFNAGFLYATLEKNLPLAEALRIGNATGSRSCLFTGGVAARSSYADIQAFLQTATERK